LMDLDEYCTSSGIDDHNTSRPPAMQMNGARIDRARAHEFLNS